jgi:predicted dehydrogenase
MKTLKGALIGCGFFSRNHLHAWDQLEGAEIVALCDRDETRLFDMAKDFGIERTYHDAQAMFEREKLDFVDIATTVVSHRPLVEMAAVAGVPVICQKPFAESMDDAHAMVEACAKA